ncbi:ANTAR domain-containing protein [Nakamurella sp. A5-74]|uniref:ANTAR domain-containing protein n=1 Tax=Nakamurella sp. A5-74 TaxID=3158264 RepID=A0AAU8DSC8_9ACTN
MMDIAAAIVKLQIADSVNQHRLWRTVESQHRIGQAQGILMEKLQISASAAVTVLHRLSQDTGTRIDDLVEQLLDTGMLLGVTDDL